MDRPHRRSLNLNATWPEAIAPATKTGKPIKPPRRGSIAIVTLGYMREAIAATRGKNAGALSDGSTCCPADWTSDGSSRWSAVCTAHQASAVIANR